MIYQLAFIGTKGEKKHVNVANSEEEFRNTTVEELKRKIQLIYDNDQACRLLYREMSLADDDTLGDYGIRNRDTLFMVIRLPGGGGGPAYEDGGIHRTESMEKLKLSM